MQRQKLKYAYLQNYLSPSIQKAKVSFKQILLLCYTAISPGKAAVRVLPKSAPTCFCTEVLDWNSQYEGGRESPWLQYFISHLNPGAISKDNSKS